MNLGLMFSSCTASYAYTLPDVLMATMCVLSVKTCRQAVGAEKGPRDSCEMPEASRRCHNQVLLARRMRHILCMSKSVIFRCCADYRERVVCLAEGLHSDGGKHDKPGVLHQIGLG